MSAAAVVLLETLCCLGLGATALRVLKLDDGITGGEQWALAFAIGFGCLGWLMYPLGVAGFLSDGPLAALLILGASATLLLRIPRPFPAVPRFDVVGRLLLALLGLILIFDLMEGIAPPADGDTLAYHFTIAKRFLETGRVEFIPVPLEGAIPLLVQMTYVPALGLGGETALTLWTMATGWAAAALAFVLCRRHLDVNWSLAVTLIFLTTPAVIYGGGSGQVEVRMSLFVMVAAWAAARAVETGRVRYAVVAGIGSGFYVAAKYLGLLFATTPLAVLLTQRRRLMLCAAFGVAAAVAGFQWYAWNMLHTGDPVFPALFEWLGRDGLTFWDQEHNRIFREHVAFVEGRAPITPLWLVLFPFGATLGFGNLLDAGRVGWGPYGLLIVPFAVLGLWRYRDRVRRSPLLVYAALVILFYVEWFFLSGTQRIRHLVPILPLFLICVTVAAERFAGNGRNRWPLMAAVATTLFVQAGAHGLFTRNYVDYIVGGADRDAFLALNVVGYPVVPWVNRNLAETDRIFVDQRQIRYYLEIPDFFGNFFVQNAIELRPGKASARTLHRQLRALGITHLLLFRGNTGNPGIYGAPLDLLRDAGCLTRLKSVDIQRFQSRSLPELRSLSQSIDVLKLRDERCLG